MKNLLLSRIKEWIYKLFKRKPKLYRTIFTEELPEILDDQAIYILGEGQYLWSAAIICPCGCGETLQMSLHKDGRPKWNISRHSDGTISLWPSVWRKCGCHSHFFFEKGHINWCKDI